MKPFNRLLQAALILWLAGAAALAQTAEEILDKATDAMGGKEAAANIKSMSFKGSVSMPGNFNGDVSGYAKDGGKLFVKTVIQAPGMQMEQTQGCDGETCYSKDNMMGARILEGQEKEAMLIQNDFQTQMDWRALYAKYEYRGMEQFEGRDHHKVYLETPGGMTMTNYYDAESYMLKRTEGVMKGALGSISYDLVYNAYQTLAHGIKAPSQMTMSMMGQNIAMTMSDYKLNPELDDSLFALPEELR